MKTKIICISLGILLSSSVSFAYSNIGCQKKEANLQTQLRYAEQHGNSYRAEGLKRAIANVRANCDINGQTIDNSDLLLNDDIQKARLNEKILQHKEKVIDAQYELEKAKLSGKPQKIQEKMLKLEKRQAKLDLYLKELKDLSQ